MALAVASRQLDLLDPVSRFCDEALPANSIFTFLHEHRERLFPDELFIDLFAGVGRRSVPPSVVATVMVLQRLEGLSDGEAVDRFTFDARWRYAAGVGGWDGAGRVGFAHTVRPGPKVERKIAHLMRRRHGGRRARMRDRQRLTADFTLLAAAVNLARLATLGLTHTIHGWALNPACGPQAPADSTRQTF